MNKNFINSIFIIFLALVSSNIYSMELVTLRNGSKLPKTRVKQVMDIIETLKEHVFIVDKDCSEKNAANHMSALRILIKMCLHINTDERNRNIEAENILLKYGLIYKYKDTNSYIPNVDVFDIIRSLVYEEDGKFLFHSAPYDGKSVLEKFASLIW